MSEWKKEKWERVPFVFNELGADGWECYSTQVLSSAVWARDGYETASQPLEMRYYFKRERDA